ncbi:DUF2637 domain-containing protein [Streptomyces mexicanus]|uniref:DUF2637 domain-containing protein n=1 Tax=Streptomyces mexicanus TaxID=178566 RepID=UPI0031E73E1D
MTTWDYGAVVTLAAVGFTLSYDALRQVAVAVHVRPQLSYLFPVVIDGFIAYGVRAIVLLRNRPFGARLYAWFLFLAATGASLWANALHAITLNHAKLSGPSALRLGDSVVGVLSTLAPLALAGSVHLYIIMARTADSSVPDRSENRPGPVRESPGNRAVARGDSHDRVPGPAPEPASVTGPVAADGREQSPADRQRIPLSMGSAPSPSQAGGGTHTAATSQSGTACGPDGPGRPRTRAFPDSNRTSASFDDGDSPSGVRDDSTDREEPSVPDGNDVHRDREPVDEWMRELLPIAREASRRAGRISRSAVQAAVRAHQPISNDRLGELIAQLKKAEASRKPTDACSGSGLW